MRMMNRRYLAGILFAIPLLLNAQQKNSLFEVDEDYLTKHDIVYLTPAYEGFEGFPVGNGDLGGMIWNHKKGIEIQLNKNDLFDQSGKESLATLRGGARLTIDLGMPGFEWLYLDDFVGRLSMKNAEVSFDSETPFAENRICSWVAADRNVWLVQISSSNKDQYADSSRIRIGLERYGSRAFPGWYGGYSKNTTIGLENTRSTIIGKDIVLEESFSGLQFSVVCRLTGENANPQKFSANRVELETESLKDHEITLLLAIVTSNESETPTRSARALLDQVENESIEVVKGKHKAWWNNFWERSFVHLGDDYMENIYYLRRYLMASSSRGKFPVVFNGGLWTWNHDVRNWVTPHHWNTQQQYWGLCAQNDCELLNPYLNTYFALMPEAEKHAKLRGAENAILWSEPHDFFGSMTFWDRGDMINNYTPASQIAGFFWEYYQYTGDSVFLETKAYPFLKKAAEFYVQKLEWDSVKNEYFIYPSQPYESPRSNDLKNPITDRNMIISVMSACIEAAQILNKDNDRIQTWQHIIDHVWPIPYMEQAGVGETVHLAYHPDGSIYPGKELSGDWMNHFSANTSLVFPANIVGLDQEGSREFKAMVNVVESHVPYRNAISPDPIVAARLGLGNIVLERLTEGIRRLQHFPQGLFYNIDHWYNLSLYMDSVVQADITTQRDYVYDERTHYPDGHPAKPFIQCGLEPMSIMGAALNEALLQSNEKKIRIFPAVPNGWAPAFKLRARGAFIVSSEMREDGTIPGILIESLAGNDCSIVNPWNEAKVSVLRIDGDRSRVEYKIRDKVLIEFRTLPGALYLISPEEKEAGSTRILKGTPNEKPKSFLEATLGKDRNF
jgi:hypothetical protein